ncbi:hypothetical protein KFL_002710020 [Klebsormidium nitens]|uniref:Uncharacterized protein n=1 Tax=Klebsormidium nitens TaxID=105231 RepID=A0A1Y1IBK5_KLENI|nr:hypothetical protein KFL_002710020 [Klebsormidium nitens]|eukprot:GAQ86107.1 hypothetical protein KFL_002710020 [Klebsormidium nitens]
MKPAMWATPLGSPASPRGRSSPDSSPESRKPSVFQSPIKSALVNRSPITSELAGSPSHAEAVKGMVSTMYPAFSPPERPLSRQQFGGPPAAVEQAVVAQSLRNENELLRGQLRDVSAQERQHRAELARLRQHRDDDISARVAEQTAGYECEREQLLAALEAAQEELHREAAERERLEHTLQEHAHSSTEAEQQGAAALRRLEAVVTSAAGAVAEMASGVEAFQQAVLPTFKVPPEALGGLEEKAPLEGDKHGLGKQVARLARGLALLRMMVDAKSDTLVLIRGKLKAEAQALRAEVAALRGQAHDTTTELRDKEQGAQQERGQLRAEMHALQELYGNEVAQLRGRLAAYERGEAGEAGAVAAVQRQLAATAERLAALEGANARLAGTLEEESGLRAQVVAQLAAHKKEAAATRSELETLKLSQKFLVRQPRGGARIPAEKMDLMNMVNHLLHEVSKVKAEKAAVEEELKAARHAHVAERSRGVVSGRDVALAADDRVHDAEIAMKLVRQRLHPGYAAERGPSRPVARPACLNGLGEAAQRCGADVRELQNSARATVQANGKGSSPSPPQDASPHTSRQDFPGGRNAIARGETSGVCSSPSFAASPDGPSVAGDHRTPQRAGAEADLFRHLDEAASFEGLTSFRGAQDTITSSSARRWLSSAMLGSKVDHDLTV